MKRVYFNPMQREVLSVGARTSVIVAGRGTGKGLLHAAVNLRNFQAMPRSTTAIVAPSVVRAKTNTIPSMTQHWEAWGYLRGVHWEIGRRPPARLGWPLPLIVPEDWANMLTFYNGACAQIVSQDRAGTSNSKSFDFIDVDEAKFIKFDQLKNETFPANRGQAREFGSCPWHHGMLITSDMPAGTAGSWFLRYEQAHTAELVGYIKALQAEAGCAGAEGKAETARLLAALRARAVFFKRYSSLENIEVLGEDFIRQQRRDLPPLVFQTSILCQPVTQPADGFYSSMTEANCYTPPPTAFAESLEWAGRPAPLDCRADGDLNPALPLCIAFDFNRNINWLVVGQSDPDTMRLNTLRAFYVKYQRKLPDLIDDFCHWYAPMQRKDVVFYFDSTALGSNYAVNEDDFRRVIIRLLTQHGWRVTPAYIGQPLPHAEKHLLINQGLSGRGRLTPMFNEEGCRDLLVSIRTAGVYNGKKDKRGEKLAETEDSRLEARTDGSDAWDTLFIGCEKFPSAGSPVAFTSNWGKL